MTKRTHLSTKRRLLNRVATATPLQSYCRHPHRIPERLMYNTGATIGENRSEEQRVKATTQTEPLTLLTKNCLTNRDTISAPLQRYCRHPKATQSPSVGFYVFWYTRPQPFLTPTAMGIDVDSYVHSFTRHCVYSVPACQGDPKAPEAPYVGFYVFWYKIRSDFAMGKLHQE